MNDSSKKSTESTSGSTKWASIAALAVIAIFLAGGGWLAYCWIEPTSAQEKNEFIRTAVAVAGGFVLIGGLYFTRETLKTSQETVRINTRNTEATIENVRLNAENTAATIENQKQTQLGLTAERFYRACEQLGNPSRHVRLGALYALESIAKDSDRDFDQVVSVISAYVREEARKDESASYDYVRAEPGTAQSSRCPEDIQAALTILGRRRTIRDQDDGPPLDLSNTVLSGARLRDANLQKAIFDNSVMHNVRIHDCNFARAQFKHADVRGSEFYSTDLRQTNFVSANLEDALLWFTPRRETEDEPMFHHVVLLKANLTNTTILTNDLFQVIGLRHAQLAKAKITKEARVPFGRPGTYWHHLEEGEDGSAQLQRTAYWV